MRIVRGWWLLGGGLAGALVGDRYALGAAIAGYLVLVAFAAVNLRVAGMTMIAVGLLANVTVILVDAGMPVRDAAPGARLGALHHPEGPDDHMTGLADVVRLTPIGETVSAGDLVLAGGAAVASVALVRSARRRSVVASA